MGSVSSKHIKESPEKVLSVDCTEISSNQSHIYNIVDGVESDANYLDPRSPHVCRTPLQEALKCQRIVTKPQNLAELWDRQGAETPARGLLAQMIISQLHLDPLDPRSPSLFINRTPIVFEELSDECGSPVCLDVSQVVTDSKAEASVVSSSERLVVNGDSCESAAVKIELHATHKLDPRSPSEGVERTPIVFSDEITDKEILESLIRNINTDDIQNKQLERVKNPRSRTKQRATERKGIYEDEIPEQMNNSTPKRGFESSTPKRTPLSCVANKSHLRSKSVENSGKSASGRLKISSFDDYNIKNRHIVCSSGERVQALSTRKLNI